MQEATATTMVIATINLERDSFLERIRNVESRAFRFFTKARDDRRHSRGRRHVANVFARENAFDETHEHRAFDVHRAFHKTTTHAVEHVFASWTRMTT